MGRSGRNMRGIFGMLAKLDRSMAANVFKIAIHFYLLAGGINFQLCNYLTSNLM